jgi:hypothetical protein
MDYYSKIKKLIEAKNFLSLDIEKTQSDNIIKVSFSNTFEKTNINRKTLVSFLNQEKFLIDELNSTALSAGEFNIQLNFFNKQSFQIYSSILLDLDDSEESLINQVVNFQNRLIYIIDGLKVKSQLIKVNAKKELRTERLMAEKSMRSPLDSNLLTFVVKESDEDYRVYFQWTVKTEFLKIEGIDEVKARIEDKFNLSFSAKMGELKFVKQKRFSGLDSVVVFSSYLPGPLFAYSFGYNLNKPEGTTIGLTNPKLIENRYQQGGHFLNRWVNIKQKGIEFIANTNQSEIKNRIWEQVVSPELLKLDHLFKSQGFKILLFKKYL